MKNNKTITMVTSAILMAMAFVLSFVKIIDYPWGGSVTLFSMFPICLISIRFGMGWGLSTAFIYSVLQLMQGLGEAMSWGLTADAWIGMILFDYLLAFTVLGLAGLFRKQGRGGIVAGAAIAIGLRYLSSVLSGAIVWKSIGTLLGWTIGNTWVYSLLYNALYMLPELAMTIAALLVLTALPQMKRWIAPVT